VLALRGIDWRICTEPQGIGMSEGSSKGVSRGRPYLEVGTFRERMKDLTGVWRSSFRSSTGRFAF